MRAEIDGQMAGGRAARRRVTGRQRRRLVSWLRLTARRPRRDAGRYRCAVLLDDRVAGVRGDLLEIAAMLEWATDPDPECVAGLYRLLRDGCDSPLYNRDIHPSEMQTTLYYAKQTLIEPRGHRHDTDSQNGTTAAPAALVPGVSPQRAEPAGADRTD